ncbi:SRPBCC family protein [Streptomyces sp. NPDC086023]|uniref:SRPBCC family protein n=1 Tax=Streptomyces sp. NPDC086023 TaxID=3365746 RepID=UPI0037CEA2C4
MSLIRIVRTAHVPPAEAWLRVTDWPRHGAQMPLTRIVTETAPPTREGTVFTARTGVGRLAFDDPMEVVAWAPPADGAAGRCRLVKRGRVVLGWAEIEVRPARDGGGGAEVVWLEEVRLRGVPRLLDAPVALAGRALFGRALDRLLEGTGPTP